MTKNLIRRALRPLIAWSRRRNYGHDGANGCCTCGGPTFNWVYWGAVDHRGVAGYPDLDVTDWAQCDACHAEDPMASLPSMRLSDEVRDARWAEFLAGAR